MSVINGNPPDGAAERTPRKAALASFMGSAVEYYDFFVFGSAAALIFPKVFFPSGDDAALVLSLATFGVAYVARPVGALILGHFGDRLGRQKVLMFTLVLMGLSTFLIGCLPTFDTIGWFAPGLLVLCRLLQGLSAAGEQAGASSLTLEHSPDHQRSFFTSWTLTGTQGGLILANLVMIPFVALPEDAQLGWGWRVPFWLSAVVVLVAYFIRRTLRRAAGVRRGQGERNHREAAAQGTAARSLARRAAGHSLRVHRRCFDGVLPIGHRLRQEGGPRGRHHAVVGRRRQRRRAWHAAAVRQARRPDRPQAGVHLRRAGLGRSDALLHAVDERRQRPY